MSAATPTTRVVLRPIGTPLPLGFIGLLVATVCFSAVQLRWVPPDEGHAVALGVLVFTVPAQLVAAVFGFLARDPVAGTGMGVLAGTWAAVTLVTLTSPPGASSSGLGTLLLVAGLAMLVPAAAATTKLVAAGVMGLSALRFAVTGLAHLTASAGWRTAAGWVGLALGLFALYAALALELEDASGRTVLPVLRRGAGAEVMTGGLADEVRDVAHEAGVRRQL